MRHFRYSSLCIALLLTALPAYAHPGHLGDSAGFVAGLLHPLLGIDHLLAMVTVGLWASQLGGRAQVLVPLSFLSLMTIGAILALRGVAIPQVEAGICVSLIVTGLVVAMAWQIPLLWAVLLTSGFALLHGAAHGAELPAAAAPAAYGAGFMLATAVLLGAGLLLGRTKTADSLRLTQVTGMLGVAAGLFYAMA